MINRLRKRVIALTMIAVFIVLLIIMGIVNAANYVSTNNSVDELLDMLEENGGTFAAFGKHDHGAGPGGQMMGPKGDNGYADQAVDSDGVRTGMTKETPYETRFFSVTLEDETKELTRMDTSRIAAVTKDEALEMAIAASESGKTSSYVKTSDSSYDSVYKYRAVKLNQGSDDAIGSTMYIFVDVTKNIDSVKRFLLISLLVSVGGLVAIGAFVIALSPMMIKPIAESYEKQKKFITNAGHELKTPLAVIKSCNEVVELENGESKWTNAISQQVDRLTNLTGQLVALSKMDESADAFGEFEKTDVDLSAVLIETLSPFFLVAKNKGLNLNCEIEGKEIGESITKGSIFDGTEMAGNKIPLDSEYPSVTVHGNKASLTELISILIDNAMKYTSDNGNIKFTLSKSGNKVTLTEENTADGLEKGNMNILFDRFYRGDQSHTRSDADGSDEPGGYGIGLSMAQAIVNAHGGKITAESPDGTTLKFTATF